MKTIVTLREKDIYPDITPTQESEYIQPRKSVRVVIFDQSNFVALGYVKETSGNNR
jgi:hypothetical protein